MLDISGRSHLSDKSSRKNVTASRSSDSSYGTLEMSMYDRPLLSENTLTRSNYSEISARVNSTLIALVVDDALSNRKMLSMLLMKRGVQVAQANDGQEALDMVNMSPNSYKLILMDNLMPVMNGIDATRALRKLGYRYLIIGVTGNVMDDDVKEFIDAGADLVLPKPFNIEVLDDILKFVEQNGSTSQYPDKILIDGDNSNLLLWKANYSDDN